MLESRIKYSINSQNYKKLPKLCLLIFCLFSLGDTSKAEEYKEESKHLTGQSLKWSGYSQVNYTHGENCRNEFRIKRSRIMLKGNVLKNINYKLQIDGGKTPILLDVKIEINFIPLAKLSFGQFKVPFSIENLISSSELDTINRSNTVENLCPGRDIGAQGRDIGITVNGKYSCLEYTLGVFNGSGINKIDYNDQKDKAGRLVFTPIRSLSIGFSHYNGRYSSHLSAPVLKKDRTGVDIFFFKNKLSLKGEYIFARDGQTERSGWYIQGGYYLIPKKLQAIVRHDSFDRNMAIREDRIVVITSGLNCFFSKKTKFQINYEYHKGGLDEAPKNVILAQVQAGF